MSERGKILDFEKERKNIEKTRYKWEKREYLVFEKESWTGGSLKVGGRGTGRERDESRMERRDKRERDGKEGGRDRREMQKEGSYREGGRKDIYGKELGRERDRKEGGGEWQEEMGGRVIEKREGESGRKRWEG
jgi:hypothetical protein